jgi:uncharacterized protein YkwD
VRIAAAAALAGLALAPSAGAQEAPPRCPGADAPVLRAPAAAEAAVACIVNAERIVRGLPPLARDPRLDAAAQGHSDDMATRGYLAHESPEGAGPGERAAAAGYPYATLSENVASGYVTARLVMDGWMASPGHCQAVLSPDPIHLGVGLAPRGRYGPAWTELFGRTQDAAPPSFDTAPAGGCPYDRLSIAPGPAHVEILALGRTGRRLTVFGRLAGEGAGRRIAISARRGGRVSRRTVLTTAGGEFTVTMRAPRGRGRVLVIATAPRVPGVYEAGRDRQRF